MQAALAECHAVAATAADTDWALIVLLYDGLRQVAPSPVVELNRAVAVAMASSPADALEIVDKLDGLDGSYLLPSVRGELLARLGRDAEAADEFDRAAAMTDNEREREGLRTKQLAFARTKRPEYPRGLRLMSACRCRTPRSRRRRPGSRRGDADRPLRR